jgi:DNA-binding GntR family transcriptional regulator
VTTRLGVIAGLDPAIHSANSAVRRSAGGMDTRAKPGDGHDEVSVVRVDGSNVGFSPMRLGGIGERQVASSEGGETTGVPADAKAMDGEGALGPASIDRTKGARALGEAVADTIVNAVAQGTLEPGQRLIEADLARQLRVSRVPVREAIKMLQAQGILKVTPHQGTRVAHFDGVAIDQVMEARIALERIAVRDALEVYRQSPRLLDRLREIVARMQRSARWSDWVELRKADVAFHHEICRASGNEIVLNLWEALARRITIIFGREIASERDFEVVIRQHEDMIAFLERGDADIARRLESHILRLRRPPRLDATRPDEGRPRVD